MRALAVDLAVVLILLCCNRGAVVHGLKLPSLPSFFFGTASSSQPPPLVIPDEVLASQDTAVLFPLMDTLIQRAPPPSVVVRNREALCGAWEVVCTRPGPKGEPQWVKYSKSLSTFSRRPSSNRNFQIFSKDGTFVNLSEYISSFLYATASGTYTLNLPAGTVPQVTATVTNVRIHVGSPTSALALGVQGTGFVTVRYLDVANGLRVFENEDGAQVLQRRLATPPPEYAAFLR
jgi:hypothetical protein